MYRGESPAGRLQHVDPDAIFDASSKSAHVTINSLRIDNVDDAQLTAQKFVLKVSLHDDGSGSVDCGGPSSSNSQGGRSKTTSGRGSRRGSTLLKLKGPRTEWKPEDGSSGDCDVRASTGGDGIARFVFDTGQHSVLRFDLTNRRGFMCFSAARSCGEHHLPFRQVSSRRHVTVPWRSWTSVICYVTRCRGYNALRRERRSFFTAGEVQVSRSQRWDSACCNCITAVI